MSELNFDPITGQPIKQDNPDTYKFDPMTGQPVNKTTTEGTNFGAAYGQNGKQQTGAQTTYGAQNPTEGQTAYGNQTYKGQSYGVQSFGGQQTSAYGYDPTAFDNKKSDKNKKIAFIVLGVAGVAFVGLLIFGAIQLSNIFKGISTEDDESISVELTDEPLGEKGSKFEELPEKEEPMEPEAVEEPQPVEEPQAVEEPEEENTEEVIAQEPKEVPAEESADTANTVGTTGKQSVDSSNMSAFALGDYSYQLPLKVSDLMADGWTFNSDKDAAMLIAAGDTEYAALYLPGVTRHYATAWLTNFSLDAQEAQDCYLTELSVSDIEVEDSGMKFSVSGGQVILGETKEADILRILGNPSRTSESLTGNTHYYNEPGEEDYSSDVYTSFTMSEEGVLWIVDIKNRREPSDFEQVEVSSDVPAYLSYYKAPTDLGDDPFSGNFKIDGVVYNLPVPLQVLIDNGWTCDSEEDTAVGAGQGYVITMTKDKKRMCVVASNFSDKATYLKNTIVTSVSGDPDGVFENGIEFPGGLNPKMSEEELLQFMKKQGITNYEHHKETGYYTIPFDQTGNELNKSGNKYSINTDDGMISSIDVNSYGWLVE